MNHRDLLLIMMLQISYNFGCARLILRYYAVKKIKAISDGTTIIL